MPSLHVRSAAGARSALAIATTLTLLLSKSSGQPLSLDQPPKNMTVLLGRYAAFHCSSAESVDGSSTILWFMNETLVHQLPQEYDASSVSSQRTDGIEGANSTLTVLGSELTNGTQYRCGVLDQATTTIVDYSAPVTLTVQGIPLPPTGLQLKSSFNRELGTFQIRLIWMPTMTLFDDTNVNRQEPTYVVYAYITLNSSVRYLYRTETTFSSKNITLEDLNVTSACNLSTVFFHVSAKFEEVGEGNMSRPAELSGRDAKDICKTELMMMEVPGGLSTNKNDDSQVIAASVGSIAGILIVIIIVIVAILIGYFYSGFKDLKVNLSANEAYGTAGSSRKTDETEICTNNINAPTVLVEDQHVYEHVHDVVKGTMMETHANQAYEPVNIGKE